jgi:hypothetical protein
MFKLGLAVLAVSSYLASGQTCRFSAKSASNSSSPPAPPAATAVTAATAAAAAVLQWEKIECMAAEFSSQSKSLTGTIVDVGFGCALPTSASGVFKDRSPAIAVAHRGECAFTTKAEQAEAAGYVSSVLGDTMLTFRVSHDNHKL